jgi:hypothetical protein
MKLSSWRSGFSLKKIDFSFTQLGFLIVSRPWATLLADIRFGVIVG